LQNQVLKQKLEVRAQGVAKEDLESDSTQVGKVVDEVMQNQGGI